MKRGMFLAATLLLSTAACAPPDRATGRQTGSAGTAGTNTDEFRTGVQRQLYDLNEQLKDLKDRAAAASAETRQKLQPQIDQLEHDLAAARTRLDELRQSSVEAWNAAQPDLEKALRHLGDAFQRASDQFKK